MISIAALHQHFLEHPVACTDTRKITKNCIFFALKGANFNGNLFATEALNAGATYCVIDEPTVSSDPRCLVVTDVLESLQQLAQFHRQQFKIPVIAIVGSNGKTTTKELITSVLATEMNVLATPGNYNNHIGLPLTLLMLNQKHQIAVIELGANHVGENAFLCKIAQPNYGLITNNGKDHLEGFGDLEGVIRSNSELYQFLREHNGTAFVNSAAPDLVQLASRLNNKITYRSSESDSDASHFVGKALQLQPNIRFSINQFPEIVMESSLSGDYNLDNIMAAVTVGLHFGINIQHISEGIANYQSTNLRSQVIHTKNNEILLDAYNANPSSMEVSIRNFAAMPGTQKLLILGDMFELGSYEAKEHQYIADYCLQNGFRDVLLVGKAFSKVQSSYHKFETTQLCREFLVQNSFSGNHVFIKGSRGMKLETLVDVIS